MRPPGRTTETQTKHVNQQEMPYEYNSFLIAIVTHNEVVFRVGRFVQAQTDRGIKALTGSSQASILGSLALLLGFTFNMSRQRYDARSMALIDEANAIGTAILRIQLLPAEFR